MTARELAESRAADIERHGIDAAIDAELSENEQRHATCGSRVVGCRWHSELFCVPCGERCPGCGQQVADVGPEKRTPTGAELVAQYLPRVTDMEDVTADDWSDIFGRVYYAGFIDAISEKAPNTAVMLDVHAARRRKAASVDVSEAVGGGRRG